MNSLNSSFDKKFERIKNGWSSNRVLQLLGYPSESEDTQIPAGSAWGEQSALKHRIHAGEPVRQWIFKEDASYHYIWFAKVGDDEQDPWEVTLKVKVSRRL